MTDELDIVSRVGGAILLAETQWTPKSAVSKERAMALAAIQAMREPTDEMLSEGFHQLIAFDQGTDSGMTAARDIWRDMIDAALTP